MKTRFAAIAVCLAALTLSVRAGSLTPTSAPAPTMYTLEEIYQKLLSNEQKLINLEARLFPPLVTVEFVTVGDAGNAADTNITTVAGNSGAVAYEYKIGKYEVTNAEYVQFLNAVDPTGVNALALYNTNMASSSHGGISNDVSAVNGAKYVVKPGRENKPVVYVSFYDAMRFCNWLHNGAANGSDTENGAYTLLPPLDPTTKAPSNGTTVERNAGAKFAVPTEDEWYKAAYYEPGGDTDDYWLYPTRGNSPPSAFSPPGTAPAANYNRAVFALTDVGAYITTVGYYGTFDMAGNVYEWIETRNGSSRILRGGSLFTIGNFLSSSNPDSKSPDTGFNDFGLRVVSP